MLFIRFVFIACVLFGGNMQLTAQTETDTAHQKSAELFRQIWSPYCPGVSLLECPSGQAQDLRDELRNRLNAGESSENLLNEMYTRFGKEKLQMEPNTKGRDLLAYTLPWAFAAVMLILVVVFVVRRTRKKNLPSPSGASISKDVLKEIESRLKS